MKMDELQNVARMKGVKGRRNKEALIETLVSESCVGLSWAVGIQNVVVVAA